MNNFEELVKKVYRSFKSKKKDFSAHPNEEELVCFLEDRISEDEKRNIKQHIIHCNECAQKLAVRIKIEEKTESIDVPIYLIEKVKEIIEKETTSFVEIILRLKGKILELIHTQADILLENQLLPAPVLRAKNIKDFKDEIHLFKDTAELRIEIKIEAKLQDIFCVNLIVKDRRTEQIIRDLRVSLFKDELELESYVTSTGKVSFDNLKPGKYKIEILSLEARFASIILEVKV